MNNYTNMSTGDIGVVYQDSLTPITEGQRFNSAIFPESFILDEPIESEYGEMAYFTIEDSSQYEYCDCQARISNNYCSFDLYTSSGDDYNSSSVSYQSNDGLIYNRDSVYGDFDYNTNTLNLGIYVVAEYIDSSPWVQKFIFVGGKDYKGTYIYDGSTYNSSLLGLTATPLDVYNGIFEGANGIQEGVLNASNISNIDQLSQLVNIYNYTSYLEVNPSQGVAYLFSGSNVNNLPNIKFYEGADLSSSFRLIKNIKTIPQFDLSMINSAGEAFWACYNLRDVPALNLYKCTEIPSMFSGCSNLVNLSPLEIPNVINMQNTFTECNNLSDNSLINIASSIPEASQLHLRELNTTGLNIYNIPQAAKDIFYNKGYLDCISDTSSFANKYLINGILYNITTADFYAIRLRNIIRTNNYYSQASSISVNFSSGQDDGIILKANNLFQGAFKPTSISIQFNTSRLANIDHMFSGCTALTSGPIFDTSNCYDFSYMFSGCNNLTSVPNYNTSKMHRAYYLFANCYNLTNFPNLDFSNCVGMIGTFRNCNKATTIPNYNTCRAANFLYTFENCSNLIDAPNFDTSNCKQVSYMFNNCVNLVNVPQYNLIKCTSVAVMVGKCNNLSDASIQNIINICLNSNIKAEYRNLQISNSSSPFYNTNISNTKYENRWTELTEAGWVF